MLTLLPDAFLGMPFHIRRQHLLENWGFNCTCSLCFSSTEQIAASDARRMRIVEARNKANEAREKGDYEGAVDLVQELIELSNEEGLKPLESDFQEMMGKLYAEKGDLELARTYGEMALDGWMMFSGADNHHVDTVKGFLRNLKKREIRNRGMTSKNRLS
jgi:tetratricopeptide (TPR) repeat protein